MKFGHVNRLILHYGSHVYINSRRKEATDNFPLSAGYSYRQRLQPCGSWSNIKRRGEISMMPLQDFFYFCMRLASASQKILIMNRLKARICRLSLDCNLAAAADSFIRKNSQAAAGNMRNLRTYSGTPVWVPSLRRRELGRIEPHQRGEGLRHPVGDHRHGAEHDADLQQRHRHLRASLWTLFKPSSFYGLR